MLGEEGHGNQHLQGTLCCVGNSQSLSHLTYSHLIPNMQVLRLSSEGFLSCSESHRW